MKRYTLYLLFLSLVSCHHITRGIVSEKRFRPAYSEMIMQYNPALKMSTPTWIYYPDTWWLGVKGIREDGKPDEDMISVTQQSYIAFNEGDSIYFK